jgi:hypothetical protein
MKQKKYIKQHDGVSWKRIKIVRYQKITPNGAMQASGFTSGDWARSARELWVGINPFLFLTRWGFYEIEKDALAVSSFLPRLS